MCVCVCSSSKVFQKFAVSKQTPSHCQCWYRRAYEKRTSGWITKSTLPLMQHNCGHCTAVCACWFSLLTLWWSSDLPNYCCCDRDTQRNRQHLPGFPGAHQEKWLCNDCLHHQYHRHHDCQLHTCKPGSAAESSTRCTFLISLKQRPFFAQTHLSAFATAALPARTGNTTTGNGHPRRRWANINLLGMSTLQAGRQAKCQAAH